MYRKMKTKLFTGKQLRVFEDRTRFCSFLHNIATNERIVFARKIAAANWRIQRCNDGG